MLTRLMNEGGYTLAVLDDVLEEDQRPVSLIRDGEGVIGGVRLAGQEPMYCDVCGSRCFILIEAVFRKSCCWWCWQQPRPLDISLGKVKFDACVKRFPGIWT